MPHRRIRVTVLAIALGLTAGAARADMMSACAPEVGRYCADVDEGRGRVSACLVSHAEKLGALCRSEVQSVVSSRLVPSDMRKIFDPAFRADLPPACVAPAAQYCPGVATGDGRVFACLYARTNRIGEPCSGEAEAAVSQFN